MRRPKENAGESRRLRRSPPHPVFPTRWFWPRGPINGASSAKAGDLGGSPPFVKMGVMGFSWLQCSPVSWERAMQAACVKACPGRMHVFPRVFEWLCLFGLLLISSLFFWWERVTSV